MRAIAIAALLFIVQAPAAHQPQHMERLPEAPARPSSAGIVRTIFESTAGTPERPSASIAWISGGDRPQFAAFGKVEQPAARTLYEIGSITKGLTGILLADMVNAGEVSLDDRLETLLPDGAGYPEAVRQVTLGQLATHTSGLPRLPGNLAFGMKDPSNPYAHYGAKELQAFLYGYVAPPGRTAIAAEYSNLGFGLLGYVLALKAGTSYEALLKERVLHPLGMRDSTITLSAEQKARMVSGHAKGAAVSNWDLDALAGAGAVRSSAEDMSKLLAALMRPPDSRVGRAIAMATAARSDMGAAKIGFGWITSAPPNGRAFTWHNGGTGGFRTFIGFTADRKAGIVVLTNGADQGPDALAVQALMQLSEQ